MNRVLVSTLHAYAIPTIKSNKLMKSVELFNLAVIFCRVHFTHFCNEINKNESACVSRRIIVLNIFYSLHLFEYN